jgi:hypothetical protein
VSWWDQPLNLAGSTKALIVLGTFIVAGLATMVLKWWLGRKS